MYTTSKGDTLSKPVFPSTVHGNESIKRWLKENRYEKILDSDGLEWHCEFDLKSCPHPKKPRGVAIEARMIWKTTAVTRQFVESGTLDREIDERLIELIGARSIELAMKPIYYTADSEEDLRGFISDIVPSFRQKLTTQPLKDIKRLLITRWIDEHQAFGQAEAK